MTNSLYKIRSKRYLQRKVSKCLKNIPPLKIIAFCGAMFPFQNMFSLLFFSYVAKRMLAHPHFITKLDSWSAVHKDLCYEIFTTLRPMETLRLMGILIQSLKAVKIYS